MKKVISIILVFSMLILSASAVFASDSDVESKNYDLSELFNDYHEYSLSEMIEFYNVTPEAYAFVCYLRESYLRNSENLWVVIHMDGKYSTPGTVFNAYTSRFTDGDTYLSYCDINRSRPGSPDIYMKSHSVLMGEKGNRCFNLEINYDFVEYIKALDSLEGNILILDLLMNLIGGEAVGVSFSFDYPRIEGSFDNYNDIFDSIMIGDCNIDGTVNGVDGYLLKSVISGKDQLLDPFAVDTNDDGLLNAKDSLALKKKIVIG